MGHLANAFLPPNNFSNYTWKWKKEGSHLDLVGLLLVNF